MALLGAGKANYQQEEKKKKKMMMMRPSENILQSSYILSRIPHRPIERDTQIRLVDA
jgi:hypothetical protein